MSYKIGIIKAISDLKDRTGSSMQAIKKHMQGALPSDKKWANTTFLTALKTGVASGDFVKVKGSYKLSQDFKKKLADAAKPKKPKKVTPKKKVAPKKKSAPKKKVAPKKKKSVPKKKAAPKKKTSSKKKSAPKKTSSKKKITKKKTPKK
mmetsp:Transcript_13503/g.19318  ORF Transcript_13503/g.19318 Transcript_13503/m.19318 type:complete len:149 (+) Transcript_13503:59-505(+)|eukprot:CAMPEP_0184862658 /NCGR_PEP_ID=MMETSP0580-20130426/7084_1 /TAXON_ID=1118495 /ORGANISM="Dactyliosolen fragilissimus" /LENGTH=148 /DNA_ID=CAMNT_0027360611 /DNA_START=151 /DNA_END=597 /DNA_ORIENTATION=+